MFYKLRGEEEKRDKNLCGDHGKTRRIDEKNRKWGTTKDELKSKERHL
jgi:hypothetical protein